MCGKFTQMMSYPELVRLYRIHEEPGDRPAGEPEDVSADRYETSTPMRFAKIIALDDQGRRRLVRMRWGLVPPWEKDPNKLRGTIHARAETLDTKPTWRKPFLEGRRGILAGLGTFNEGKEITEKKTQQFVVKPRDGKPLAIAVVYERREIEGAPPLFTYAMVTTEPNALISTITIRMPAVLRDDQWGKWLGEEPATPEELKAMLTPYEGDWNMEPQDPPKPPRPSKSTPQPNLF